MIKIRDANPGKEWTNVDYCIKEIFDAMNSKHSKRYNLQNVVECIIEANRNQAIQDVTKEVE